MSHFEATEADIKSRAPISRRYRNAASQERLLCFVGSHKTEASHVAVVDEDNIEEEGSEVTVMEIDDL